MRAERQRRSGVRKRRGIAGLVTTLSSRIVAVDARTAALLRRTVESLVGKHLTVLVALEDRDDFRAHLTALSEGGLVQDWRFRLQGPDGRPIRLRASIEPAEGPAPEGESRVRWLLASDGNESGAPIAPSTDGPLGELVSDLVHELNQPLAAIISFARGCVLRAHAGQLPTAVVEEVMAHIVEEASRAAGILRARGDLWRTKS